MEKPTLPKGTRDFGPAVMAKRQFILDTIRSVFKKFGFQPLETPAMENLSTLTGKYGDEGDQLLFKIVDSGDFLQKIRTRETINIESFLQSVFAEFTKFYFKNPKYSIEKQEIRGSLEGFLNSKNYKMDVETSIVEPWKEHRINDFIINNIDLVTTTLEQFYYDSGLNFYNAFTNPLDIDSRIKYLKDKVNYTSIVDTLTDSCIANFPSKTLTAKISQKGLRYDLTVPFARYVVMNRNEITFPFKRYQIQPVWRGDNPQKGRYREFYQCDADVVGTDSLICEAEIILMIKEVFSGLGLTDYTIKINHRGVLSGLAESIGAKGNETALFVAIDKLDKIGEEKVKEELRAKGFEGESLDLLFQLLNTTGSNATKLDTLRTKFHESESGIKGISDLNQVFQLIKHYDADLEHVEFDIALARGLSYYTGCIFEVKINNVSIGSVSGGGRYDNLTQAFGDKENLSGVGFSFGVDRLYDALEELKLFPKNTAVSSKALLCHFDSESFSHGLALLTRLRTAGIASEIYPDQTKIKKQLDYANKKSIPFCIMIGSDEIQSGQYSFKDMAKGEQEKLTIEALIQKLQATEL